MDKKNERFTGIVSECHSCILNQARSAALFAELTKKQTNRILDFAAGELERAKTTPLLVQHIVRNISDAIIKELGESGDFDIYSQVKKRSNILALSYAEKFQKKIDRSKSPFEMSLQIAAAGNIIDFGAKSHGSLDLDKELRILNRIPFARYDIDPFKEALNGASTLLYICDNCGEIVFDMPFIKELQKRYPDIEITAAFRDKPIINDAVLRDAEEIGFNKLVRIVSSGSIYPGTILPETTKEFQRLFHSADVILSKGQGNFETLLPRADKKLFFLLRIKCEYMAAMSGLEKDNLVLFQGNRTFKKKWHDTGNISV